MAIRIIMAAALAIYAFSAQAGVVRTVPTDYAKFAACAYGALDRAYPSMVRLTDLRGADTIKITVEETAVGLISSATNRFVDMDVRKAGKGAQVEIRGAGSLFSSETYAERAWLTISACQ